MSSFNKYFLWKLFSFYIRESSYRQLDESWIGSSEEYCIAFIRCKPPNLSLSKIMYQLNPVACLRMVLTLVELTRQVFREDIFCLFDCWWYPVSWGSFSSSQDQFRMNFAVNTAFTLFCLSIFKTVDCQERRHIF